MAWAVRISLGLLVVAYAAWLGLPLAQALSSGQTIGQVWAGLAPSGSFQETGMAALLLVTIALYSLGGLATEVGFGWAPGLFFFGFVGEIALRLAVFSGTVVPAAPVLGIGAQVEAALATLGRLVGETAPISLAALLAVGLCIVGIGAWRGHQGTALTQVWTPATLSA